MVSRSAYSTGAIARQRGREGEKAGALSRCLSLFSGDALAPATGSLRRPRSRLTGQPLPRAPVVGVEELATPEAVLGFAGDDLGRMQRAVVCQGPAVDDHRMCDVRIPHVADPPFRFRHEQAG